ncbi:MAG: CDP-alcohol phosphatidyltransferase [Hyperionvirus sp.]|uniref:CDP-alcohol phosphatidyltransferase n=1 Tax=Hyperionvirus sp. TaxID=2487770 RepID=A0A3G5A8J5_9VIRU|nr:MAG: CDP-alcohol phosphatidyltransferase [Hyperionvirus sp.]
MVKKLPDHLGDPVDNIFASGADFFCPLFKCFGATPNLITSLSLVAGLGAIYQVWRENYKSGALLFILAYFLDVMDGFYARKYNMETKFGDWYDHISDTIKNGIMLLLVIYLLFVNEKYFVIGIIILVCCMVFINLGCQEKYVELVKSEVMESVSLNNFKWMCRAGEKDSVSRQLSVIRFAGPGIGILIISGIIYNLEEILK